MSFRRFAAWRNQAEEREEEEASKRDRQRHRESSRKRRAKADAMRPEVDHTHTQVVLHMPRVHKVHMPPHTHAHTQSSSERDRGGPSSYCNVEVSIPLHYRTVRDNSRALRFRERALRHGTIATYARVCVCPPLCPFSGNATEYKYLDCPPIAAAGHGFLARERSRNAKDQGEKKEQETAPSRRDPPWARREKKEMETEKEKEKGAKGIPPGYSKY